MNGTSFRHLAFYCNREDDAMELIPLQIIFYYLLRWQMNSVNWIPFKCLGYHFWLCLVDIVVPKCFTRSVLNVLASSSVRREAIRVSMIWFQDFCIFLFLTSPYFYPYSLHLNPTFNAKRNEWFHFKRIQK